MSGGANICSALGQGRGIADLRVRPYKEYVSEGWLKDIGFGPSATLL